MFNKKKMDAMQKRIDELEFKLKWREHQNKKDWEFLKAKSRTITPAWLTVSKEEFKELFDKIKEVSKRTPLYFVEVFNEHEEEKYAFINGEAYKIETVKSVSKGNFKN